MASVQARHTRSCAIGRPWTTFEAAEEGCTCKPMYHVVRRVDGKLVREAVGHDRQGAQRKCNAVTKAQDDGADQLPSNITFRAWADEWFASLRRPKANTMRFYVSTLDYAKAAFGDKQVRKLTHADVQAFLALIATEKDELGKPRRPRSTTTQAKHLRVLRACLKSAVKKGHAARNPVDLLDDEERPRIAQPDPAYFTDAELVRLWPQLPNELPAAVYLYLCKTAVTTGMREGELLALRWNKVRLLDLEIDVESTYTPGIGITTPRNGKTRVVDLTLAAASVLEEWFRLSGCPDEGLVFPDYDGGYLSASTITRRILYPAMEEAGIPRVGEGGRKRNFHSLKHSFARIALEHGAEITWVSQQLAHSSIQLTVKTYGRWSRRAEKMQAARLEGAFVI